MKLFRDARPYWFDHGDRHDAEEEMR